MSSDILTTREEIVLKLRDINFIGEFPNSISVLLVPLETALEEVKFYNTNITKAILKDYLRKSNIFLFPNVEDWIKFKGKSK